MAKRLACDDAAVERPISPPSAWISSHAQAENVLLYWQLGLHKNAKKRVCDIKGGYTSGRTGLNAQLRDLLGDDSRPLRRPYDLVWSERHTGQVPFSFNQLVKHSSWKP